VVTVTYSVEIVEGWIPWKVLVAGAVPVAASVIVTVMWYSIGYGGAFQIGILTAVLGWGIVALWFC